MLGCRTRAVSDSESVPPHTFPNGQCVIKSRGAGLCPRRPFLREGRAFPQDRAAEPLAARGHPVPALKRRKSMGRRFWPESGEILLAGSASKKDVLTRDLREQSRNVYENKGPARKSITHAPLFARRGTHAPLLGWGGLVGGTLRAWRAWRLGVKRGLCRQKSPEQSQNVYENKGPC
jgi:hypothetical protein